VGCADEEAEVELCRAVPFVDVGDDPCPPTRYVSDTDALDAAILPELEFETATELNNPPMVALVAVEVDSKLLVES
jgi:hypothetical protein